MANQRTTAPRTRGRQVQKKSNTIRWLAVAGVLLLIAGVVYLLVFASGGSSQTDRFEAVSPGDPRPTLAPDAERPGSKMTDEGAGHVRVGEQVDYQSNPPTSGAHWPNPAEWGIYDSAPPDERVIHSLEHGGVAIYYNPETLSGQDLEQLKSLTRELADSNPRIILTPRQGLEAPVVLTSWGYMQKLDSFDAESVRAYYEGHIGRGPECTPDGRCP